MRVLLVALALLGCSAPKDALTHSCTYEPMSTGGHCELAATKLVKNQTAYVDARTKNARSHVEGTFAVRSGKVTVSIGDCSIDVTPTPTKLSCDAAVNRNNFTIAIDAVVSESAEGFSGSVDFQAL